MKILLTTLNAKYIHKNLALRCLYVTKPESVTCELKEYTIKDDILRIANELLERDDDVIAFSTYIWNVEQTSEIIHMIKDRNPHKHIVLGGPEVSFDAPDFLQRLRVDAVVCGEGEFVFWEYIESLQSDTRKDIDGVYTKTAVPTVKYAMADLQRLETYEKPYFLDIDKKDMAKRYFYMETSRGCPYRCAYCLSSVQGRVRMFSQDYVLDVLRQVFQSSIRQIKFLDRTFNVDKHRALLFASVIHDNARKDQIFQFEIMAEHVSGELIDYLQNKPKHPQFRFEIGIQSTNPISLREIDRVQNFTRLKSVIGQLQESGNYELHVDLIAGLPFEDIDSFKKSFNEVFSLRASELQLGFLKLLRGTSLRKKAHAYGMVFDPRAPYEVSQTNWISEAEMNEIHEVCYALDVLYNIPRAKQTIFAILQHKLCGGKHDEEVTPYDVFAYIGKALYHTRFKQLDELFAKTYAALQTVNHSDVVLGLLANDYYRLFKQRPKRFHSHEIEKNIKQNIVALLQDQHTTNELIHYGMVDYGCFDDKGTLGKGYLFVLYNKEQTYPLRYSINKDITQARLLD